MKKILLILTCIAVLLSLAGCAEATVTDYDETHYSDTDVTENSVSEVSNPLLDADLSDGTVNEGDGEMVPYKTDEPVNPLLDADFEGATVYIMRNNVNDEAIEMDEETKSEFLELLMSLEMDETPTVDENQYAIGEYVARYTIVFSDETEYLIYFMSVSSPVGNGLYGSAQYIVVGDNKYCIPDDSETYSLIQEIESYYHTQYLIDNSLDDFCEIMDSCANVAPGSAGSSLRAVSAAGSLLDWAEYHQYILSEDAITSLLEKWQAGCEDWELENLSESWESVVGSINEIVSDPTDESLLGLLDDSGYELQYSEYDKEMAELIISAINNFIAQ